MKKILYTITAISILVSGPSSVYAANVDYGYYSSNNILFYDPNSTKCSGSPGATGAGLGGVSGFDTVKPITLKGANNAEKVMNFLLDNGFPIPAAAGMMGNFYVESRFDPNALNSGSGAYGLAQWLGGRKDGLMAFGGSSYNTLETQVQWLMHELQTDESASMAVTKETDPVQAAVAWEALFERSGAAAVGERSASAKKIYDEWTASKSLSGDFTATSNGTATSSSAGGCASAGAGASVFGTGDLQGYAFPIAVTGKGSLDSFGGALNLLPCAGRPCHHDGTYAFDLGVKGYGASDPLINPNSIGAPVYSVSDGQIVNRIDNSGSRQGCTEYYIKSTKDDHIWAYIHLALQNAVAQNGQTVTAGQLLGYVGPSICADNTAPHLHIDSGGGITTDRNELVSQVINGLYEQLPN